MRQFVLLASRSCGNVAFFLSFFCQYKPPPLSCLFIPRFFSCTLMIIFCLCSLYHFFCSIYLSIQIMSYIYTYYIYINSPILGSPIVKRFVHVRRHHRVYWRTPESNISLVARLRVACFLSLSLKLIVDTPSSTVSTFWYQFVASCLLVFVCFVCFFFTVCTCVCVQ